MKNLITTLIFLFTALNLNSAKANAQIYHEECKEDLRAFMRQGTNYVKLGLAESDTLSWYDNENWISKLPIRLDQYSDNVSWIEFEDMLRLDTVKLIALGLEGELKFSSPKLTYLECAVNKLTKLDVSKNTELTLLVCSINNLTEIDVSKNIKLDTLGVNDNNLTEIDVSKNTELLTVKLIALGLEGELKFSSPKLTYLECAVNKLTKLDVSKNTELDWLFARENNLSELDVSNNTKLKTLHLMNNKLTELDISKNVDMIQLGVNHNLLSKLDARKNVKLFAIHAHNNNLTELYINQLDISCQHNFLRFSTLPIIIPYYYIYSPQAVIWGGEKGYLDTVDLSSEYNINGHITSFGWFDITAGIEQPITQPINENGVFTFSSEHIDTRLRCKMKNAQFPALTLVYEVDIKLVNIEEDINEFDFVILPNPTDRDFNIIFDNPETQKVSIDLIDIEGKIIFSIFDGVVSAGIQVYRVNENLASGVYFVKFVFGNKVMLRKVVVRK